VALAPGTRLGAYEITALIGSGGMGEVYRARDTRLDRTVSIKVLPSHLAGDPQLRERFDREARAISSLNHPHICVLHDVGCDSDVDFLVLEFLEGQTLAERLEAGPLPVNDALRYAIQICDALDKAHRSGIVHRDLKPANVMLTKAGAKLLDFGLAKPASPVVAAGALSMLPTTPPGLTAHGAILGTFQYMAPEQIEGVDADARTDLFAFGAVAFEMITGRPAFEGKTRAQLLGAILKDEPPPVSTLEPRVPKALDRIVGTCLAKDPDDRWQTARDLLRELRWIAVQPVEDDPIEARRNTGAARTWRPPLGPAGWTIVGLVAVALVATGTLAIRHLRETPPATDPIQFSITAPENLRFGGPAGGGTGGVPQLAVSPDGRQAVFVAGVQSEYALWVRPLGSLASRQLAGTAGATFPFWSPDSRFVGFFAEGRLKKVPVSGGPPMILCDASQGRGGTWNRDNVIVFSPDLGAPLQRVSSPGGVPVPVSALDAAYGETGHRWPHFLPDGHHFLFTGITGTCCPPSKPGRIQIGSLESKDTVVLTQAESAAEYASGHVLFHRDGTLMAQPFDLRLLRPAGDSFPLSDRVAFEGSRYASFAISDTGVLVYSHGATSLQAAARLRWYDRTGKVLATLGDPGSYYNVALSPDERRVAVSLQSGSPPNTDIWIIDASRGVRSRLTFDPTVETAPVWSPDNARVAFLAVRPGQSGVRVKPAAGTAKDEPLLTIADTVNPPIPNDWSPDGRFIAYEMLNHDVGNRADVWILPLTGDKKPFPFVEGPGAQTNPAFSPDGRWIAYSSDESGSDQVYVQPFPATGGRFQVSKIAGTQPLWRADGKELFFLAAGTIMAAAIDTTREFEAGEPQTLFAGIAAGSSATASVAIVGRRQYAVTRDGKRFLMITPEGTSVDATLTVVVNWLAGIQK
jgi:serine/threonine protein kinase/Tol biopolymer transport system component